ncbi:Putative transposase (plasmid) [Cupriavidus necator H16]
MLRLASIVSIVVVSNSDGEPDEESGARLASWLASHGVGAEMRLKSKPAARNLDPTARRGGAWSERTPGAQWRNEAIDAIARNWRGEWKRGCGYHCRSLIENLMYRLKTSIAFGRVASASQSTEVAIRVGVLNRMVALARPQSVRIA